LTLSTRRDKICWLVWRAISMKTFLPNAENRKRGWFVIDADGIVLGRLATRVASLLRGKHKVEFTPHIDTGDGVIVVNAAKVRLTGRKAQRDFVYRHSGYAGGFRAVSLGDMLKNKPEELVADAVRGMLPKNSLGRTLIKHLRVYRGAEHPHFAQKPEKLEVGR